MSKWKLLESSNDFQVNKIWSMDVKVKRVKKTATQF